MKDILKDINDSSIINEEVKLNAIIIHSKIKKEDIKEENDIN